MSERKDVMEIRWHGRGGQGAVTAAKIVAAAAMREGKHFQGFPDYGPERRGAPVRAYNRISSEPMYNIGPIRSPGVVVVLDESLVEIAGVADGAGEETTAVINSGSTPEEVSARMGVPGIRVVTIDADAIATEALGRPIVNTTMIGAVAAVTGAIGLPSLESEIRHTFEGQLPPKAVEGNVTAARRAFELLLGGDRVPA